MCREQDLLAFEAGCVVQTASNDDNRTQLPARKAEAQDSGKRRRGRPPKLPVSARGRKPEEEDDSKPQGEE